MALLDSCKSALHRYESGQAEIWGITYTTSTWKQRKYSPVAFGCSVHYVLSCQTGTEGHSCFHFYVYDKGAGSPHTYSTSPSHQWRICLIMQTYFGKSLLSFLSSSECASLFQQLFDFINGTNGQTICQSESSPETSLLSGIVGINFLPLTIHKSLKRWINWRQEEVTWLPVESCCSLFGYEICLWTILHTDVYCHVPLVAVFIFTVNHDDSYPGN